MSKFVKFFIMASDDLCQVPYLSKCENMDRKAYLYAKLFVYRIEFKDFLH